MGEELHICIVSHNGYGAISGGGGGFVGGVERQTSLLARWLAGRGHQVSYLTWDEGGPAEEMFDGVRVIKVCRKNEGLPGFRFFHPKWTGLERALCKASAEVYYHNCGECVTGQMAIWCRRSRKPFVFSAASDADCDPEFPELPTRRERWLYLHGLRHADRVIVQTRNQQRLMAKNFHVTATVIPIAAPEPTERKHQPHSPPTGRVLWIGRWCKVKRPDRLIEIARACPELKFDVAGPVYEDEASRRAAAEASALPNVTLHGAVARAAVPALYREASLLCCTSDYEGFPNTFLEAWSHGVPVVSTVDPDGVVSEFGLGAVETCAASQARCIKQLMSDQTALAAMSERVKLHFAHHHSMETVMPQFERVLADSAHRSRS